MPGGGTGLTSGNINMSADVAPSHGGNFNFPSMKKGGRIKKTGVYRLHKGERVVPARKAGRRK